MLQNYLTIALRNLWRNFTFSFINIGGLAVGLTACLLIMLYVGEEISYDRFHQKSDRIVRVTMDYSVNGEVGQVPVTGTKVGPALARSFPEVEKAVRMIKMAAVVRYGDKLLEEKRFFYADSTFFDIFSFPLLSGKAKGALDAPNQVVLTQSAVRKYFGNENALGKVLRINDNKDFVVTGVTADVPENSQMKFDFIASFSSLNAAKTEEWWSANYITYLLLRSSESIPALQAKIPGYMKAQAKETEMTDAGNYLSYQLEPLEKVHLHSTLSGFEPNGDIKYVYIFSGVALLILLIACVNYVNLTTAQATRRAREVGMRKVLGAVRGQLFWQFIGEALLITFLGLLLSLLLVRLLLPYFNALTEKQLSIDVLLSPFTLVLLVGMTLVLSLLAGSFPALALSRFQPIRVLKGSFQTSGSGVWLRKGLIVFQFVISTFLIVSTLVVHHQLRFIRNKKLGYDNQHVVVLQADGQIAGRLSTFKSELKSNPLIEQVTLAYETPTYIQGAYGLNKSGEAQGRLVRAIPVEKDFIKTLGLSILTGSDYTEADEKAIQQETEKASYSFILNETAVKELGWTPETAIGQKITMSARQGEIKAVVKDFHFAPMHESIAPLAIFMEPLNGGKMLVKISGEDVPGTMHFLETQWKKLAPHRPFEYEFLNEEYGKLYRSEQRIGSIFGTFAFLAILLACLGLFGLSAYTTTQRTKEIGIRKVLGATVTQVVALLSRDFLLLVLLANVIAWPLAYFAMDRWLQDFVYRIDLAWWVFALSGASALLIALLTVGYQAIKAALSNPVKSLRTE
jgi:putative ABC transport system permease protein